MKKALRILLTFVREVVWIGIAVACVYGGYIGFQYLGDNKKVVEIAQIERPTALVETIDIVAFDQPLPIRSEGFVRPFRQVSLSTQSGGRIAGLHDAVLNLGTFETGEVLVQLDDNTERAQLDQTIANVAATRARFDLVSAQLERTRELFNRGVATRQALDQLLSQEAELIANLNSLIASQKSSQIAVENKRIVAPFDGAVLEKLLEVGSVVTGGQAIAELYTHEQMEVVIPLREAEAALIPGLFGDSASTAKVNVDFAGQTYQWPAHITRVAPALDPRTRTLSVTVGLDQINNPTLLGESPINAGTLPAIINTFAKVRIDGSAHSNTYAVPTTSIRSGNQIWVFNEVEGDRGTLHLLDVRPTHVDGETTYAIVEDWPENSRLVSTTLAAPTPGMNLRDISVREIAMNSAE